MWLNGVAKSFVEQYQKIGQEKIDFPTQEMEKNLQEISAVLDQEEDILESTVSVSYFLPIIENLLMTKCFTGV